MELGKDFEVKTYTDKCPSCKGCSSSLSEILSHWEMICRNCGYIYCFCCSESYSGGHKHQLSNAPSIIRKNRHYVVQKSPLEWTLTYQLHTVEEWYCTVMRIAALLNTTARIMKLHNTQMLSVKNVDLLKHLCSIMGRDKHWILVIFPSNGKNPVNFFIWSLCKALILNYSFMIGDDYFKNDHEKLEFFAHYEGFLDSCKSVMDLKKQSNNADTMFTATNVSQELHSILPELLSKI